MCIAWDGEELTDLLWYQPLLRNRLWSLCLSPRSPRCYSLGASQLSLQSEAEGCNCVHFILVS